MTDFTIPGSVTTIGDFAIAYCSGLTGITIPAAVTSIGSAPFLACTSLADITVVPSNPAYTDVGGVLFDKSMTQLLEFPAGKAGACVVPDGVTTIGLYAFYGCPNLTSVLIPNSVTAIRDSAFAGSTSLTNVSVGNGLASIGFEAFYECSSLASLSFSGNAPDVSFPAFEFYFDFDAVVYYLPWTSGWGPGFAGLPTVPGSQELLAGAAGVQTNQFGFTLAGPSGQVVVVEAATDFTHPVWIPLSTNTLIDGISFFSDSDWTNYPGRFYRLSAQ